MTNVRQFAQLCSWAMASIAFVAFAFVACCQSPDSFNPSPNYWVAPIVVQTDGKIVFGGGFTTVTNQSRGHVARVNADGTLDATFQNPAASDDVYALALQPDGKSWSAESL